MTTLSAEDRVEIARCPRCGSLPRPTLMGRTICDNCGGFDVPQPFPEVARTSNQQVDDWIAYLSADPPCEPYLTMARVFREQKAEIERLQSHLDACRANYQLMTDERNRWRDQVICPSSETTDPLEHMRWVCIHCTTVNGKDKTECLGCGKPRYAHRAAMETDGRHD